MPHAKPYKRVLLKLSGEALQGSQKFGIEHKALVGISEQIKILQDLQVQVGIVVGGGNLFRGSQVQELGLDRTPADQVGMIATIMNGIMIQQTLQKLGCKAQIFSALDCGTIVEKYNWQKVMQCLEQNHVAVFVGGTSNPYFTTDTAAALRAAEIHADVLFKLTKVDGIYDKDPKKHPEAVKFSKISFSEVLAKGLGIMDLSAVAICKMNNIPICVFDLDCKESLRKAALREEVGTLVTGE
jgi:uridylate kinase